MRVGEAIEEVNKAIEGAPRNGYVAELHIQCIKYADVLSDLTGREFTEAVGIGASFGTEFIKMRKIADRLKAAGLDPSRL